ncbi:AraC family transcriptional regulator [Flavobacterium sp. KBS0721]|uniref:helix-turn-helix domain-containing protein n=1 Tax=Flavobacterium sp. KBS0721 TaxID=1179672 RepID=UPI00098F92BA|nr:AraC family transcriptional regulator [Flavobacterium sp. KBS0721]QDW22419.1 helix-turn-helix transcriptional regulator [Flavobacterium sp. KBS0721]
MKKISHYYSLTPEWQSEFVQKLGAKFIDGKITVIPESMGKGHSYFTQIIPGISVLFIDFTLKIPLKITRNRSDNPLYIFHFDLSEHVNLIKINNKSYEIGSYDKLDLAIIDNQIESSFTPSVNERTIAIRILVDKALLNDFIKKHSKKEEVKPTTKEGQRVFYHYGNIDSNSILLIQSIKNKSVFDLSFEPLLKGISLKLLGNFFNKFYHSQNSKNATDSELEAINKTKEYLLNNLYGLFPSVTFLASMAGMSESKYKILFKKCFNDTPNNLFIKEKMSLAQRLLKSGEFKTITNVLYELNYSKLSYFSSKYFNFFKNRPIDDFIRKQD